MRLELRLLGPVDLFVDRIEIGVVNDGVEGFEDAIFEKCRADAIGQIVQLIEGALEFGVTLVIRTVHAEHADENLLEHS